jgi:Ser/Thr protein kinase RdoA (MazF antagonist)
VFLGDEVGRGFRSVVYSYGADEVAKVPNIDVPPTWLNEELRLADIAARAGAPVPDRRRIEVVAGQRALLLERIDGPSVWDLLTRDPKRSYELGVDLARVQADLTLHHPSFELPSQRDRVIAKIHQAAKLHGAEFIGAIDRLPTTREPLVVCHGDLHPRNVLVSPRGRILVDWFDASRGSIAGEIARTLVIFGDVARQCSDENPQLAAATVELSEAYQREALALAGIDSVAVAPWLLAQGVARLAEGFGGHRIDALRRQLVAPETRAQI